MELAHPLTEPGGLPVPPAVVATVALCALAAIWRVPVPLGPPRGATACDAVVGPREDRLAPVMLATRALGVVLLLVAIAAGRLGSDRELENLAPILVVGAGWPVLVLASALFGDVWRWLDPFDTLARLIAPAGQAEEPPGDVRWAIPAALVWVGYLTLPTQPLAPRNVGALLALYTIATLAGCLAVGRRRWLARAEVIGVTSALVGRLRRGRLQPGALPRGAGTLLAVLAGGLIFDLLRISSLWPSFAFGRFAVLWLLLGLLGCAAIAAGVVRLAEGRAATVGAPGLAAIAAVPVAVGVVLAAALARSRLLTSVQLVVSRISDPFGFGWNVFGTADVGLVGRPLSVAELVSLQVAVLVIGGIAGVVVARRRTDDRRRQGPAVAVACVLCGATILAVTAV